MGAVLPRPTYAHSIFDNVDDLRRVLLARCKNLSFLKFFFFLSRTSCHASPSLHFPLGVFCDITLSLFSRLPVDRNKCDNFCTAIGGASPSRQVILYSLRFIFVTFFLSYSFECSLISIDL